MVVLNERFPSPRKSIIAMDINAKHIAVTTALLHKYKDEELLKLLEGDCKEAFEALYIRYKKKLHKLCLKLIKSDTVAQDIVQEVFITVWTARKTFNAKQSFSSYLYTLAKNKALNELRSAKRKQLVEDLLINSKNEVSEADSADTKLIIAEYQLLLENAINQLPEQKRKIYTMSRQEGLTHKEIALKLNLSHHTVQSHISDALHSISDYLFRNADIEFYFIFAVFLTQ